MSTFIRSAIFAAAVLAGLSAVEARSYTVDGRTASQYHLNSAHGAQAFWDHQRHSGN